MMSDKLSPAETEAVVPVARHAQETSDASVNVDNLEESLDMNVPGHTMPPPTSPAATGAPLETILEEDEDEDEAPVPSDKAKGKKRAIDTGEAEDESVHATSDDDAASGREAQIAHDERMARALAASDPAVEILDDVAPAPSVAGPSVPAQMRARAAASPPGSDVDGDAPLEPGLSNFLVRLTGLIPPRRAPYAWWERMMFIEGVATRDDAQFLSMLRQPVPDGDGRSVLTMLADGQTALAAALDPAGRGLVDGDLRDAVRIQEVGMRWVGAQQDLLRQLNGETSLSRSRTLLYVLQAAALSSLPIVVAALPTPKNGAYLAGATAASLRYSYQMVGLLRLETVDDRTLMDSLVNRQWTWAANALALLGPTIAGTKGVVIKGKEATGLEVVEAAVDLAALLGLERRAKLFEAIVHRKSGDVRAGEVGLPLAEHTVVQDGLRDVRGGIDALQALRRTFEERNFRITGGLSSQLTHLLTDQLALEGMLQSSINAVVGSRADIEATPGTEGEGSRVGPPQGLMVRLRAIDDLKRKLMLLGLAMLIQTLQVVLASKNPALLPDYLAYLFVVTSAMFTVVANPANEYQDVEATFLDYNAGSILGLPEFTANFAKPAQLEIGEPKHVLGFSLWTLYLCAANLTISPFVGAWLSTALAALVVGVTPGFRLLAAHYNALTTMQPGDTLPVIPHLVEADFHRDVANAPPGQVERLTALTGLGTAMVAQAEGQASRVSDLVTHLAEHPQDAARFEEITEDPAFGEDPDAIALQPLPRTDPAPLDDSTARPESAQRATEASTSAHDGLATPGDAPTQPVPVDEESKTALDTPAKASGP